MRKGLGSVLSVTDADADQGAAAHRRRGVAAEDPAPLRLRHDPRLPDDLPDPAGHRCELRSARRERRREVRRARVGRGRAQADLRADGRRLARAALGPDRRGCRRGSVPELGARQPPASRPSRAATTAPATSSSPARSTSRPTGSRRPARLQHDRHVRAAALEPLPAAVQGRDRCRRGHRHVLVQRDQRRARLRERRPDATAAQGRVALRRVRRERLDGRGRAPRLPAEDTRPRRVRARRRGRRPRRRCARAQRRRGLGDDQHPDPRPRCRPAGPAARSR